MTVVAPPSDRPGRYDRFFALSTDPLCISTVAGRLVDVNPAWERTLGWPREELLGRAFLDLVHPDDQARTRAAIERIAEGQVVQGFENRYRHRDGTWRWLAWSSTPAIADGLVHSVVRDVTVEHRARAWAEEMEQVSGVGTWELDLETQELVLSPETFRIHGIEPAAGQAASPERIRSLYHPEDAARQDEALDRLLRDGAPYDLTLRLRPQADAARWVRVTGRARVRDGVIVRVYGSLQDITERHEQQRRLEEANARLQRAQELAKIGDWHADLRTGALTWSPVIFRIFGFDPATMTPSLERFRASVHPDDLDALLASEERAGRTGSHEFVHRIVRPDGTVRVVREIATSHVDDEGALIALAGTVQDVTETHESERALRASEAQLARAITASGDGWWEVDLSDGTTRCADRWWELHGYEPAAIPASLELLKATLEAEQRPQVVARFSEAFARQDPLLELRSTARRRDGSTFPVELRVLIEYAADGTATRITGTTRDLTEVVRSERLQEEFLATVSHELRTPLTSIGGALELLQAGRGGALDEGAEELLSVASRNTRRLRRLIDDLLDAERLATGRQGVVLRSQRLVPVLERIVEDHVGRPDGGEVELVLEVGVPPTLELPIDPDRIGQVLANYLSNAVRYAPPGSSVRIEVTRSHGRIRVGVLDRGPGVPEGFEQRAFTRFSQADPDDARSRGGTGLGLAISREIVERHEGTVGYDSMPGRTEFYFTLPLPS